jgi:hypothetical protein
MKIDENGEEQVILWIDKVEVGDEGEVVPEEGSDSAEEEVISEA